MSRTISLIHWNPAEAETYPLPRPTGLALPILFVGGSWDVRRKVEEEAP